MSSGVLDTPLQLSSCPSFHCPQGFCIEVNDDTEMKLVTQLRWLPAHACIKIWLSRISYENVHEPVSIKRYKLACALAEDSDQPAHLLYAKNQMLLEVEN